MLSGSYVFADIFYKKGLYNSFLVLHLQPDTFEVLMFLKIIECENSSVGRARPCQGRGRGFEPRFSLFTI